MVKKSLTRQKLKTQLFNSIKNEISDCAAGTYCLFAFKRLANIAVLANPASLDAADTNQTKQNTYFHLLSEIICSGNGLFYQYSSASVRTLAGATRKIWEIF